MRTVTGIPCTLGMMAGDGLVTRFGDVVVLLSNGGQAVAPLLAAVKVAADATNPGATLAEHLASLAFSGDLARVPFGAVAPTDGGLLLLLRGKVVAEVEGGEGARRLSGERAMTWVDEVLPPHWHRISVWFAEKSSPNSEELNTDLQRGVVSGGGFVMRPARALQDAERVSQTVVSTRTVVGEQIIDQATMKVQGAPMAFEPRRGADETSTARAVDAALVADDGAVYPLDRSYVIGRDPLRDDSVRTATATPITLQADSHISRIHAYISVDGDTVTVRDASTPGGTFVAAPGATQWTEIDTSPVDLPLGWSMRVGERIFTHRGDRGD
jgi:hypothetical protein